MIDAKEEIKANELRINNWVMWGKLFATVASVHSNYVGSQKGYEIDYIVWLDLHNGKPSFCPQTQWDITPIPLSPEVLIACGFVQIDDKVFQKPETRYVLNDFTFISFLMWRAHPMTNIIYLHQLQNLFYSLTSKEIIYQP